MSPRIRAAAALAGAAITLAVPTQVHAAIAPPAPVHRQAPVATVHRADHGITAPPARGRHHRHVRFGGVGIRHFSTCPFRKVLIAKNIRAVLRNCRRGPTAVIESTKDNSVLTFLDVNYPAETTGSYELRIIGFFRRHPALLVQHFDHRPWWIYFLPSRYHYRYR